jgi:NAD(P)-dependent dehydrogenase (short-subunit alcohol dehydrogenase family)
MGQLDGRVALVTGGASGLGRSTATRFALEGAAVVIADVDEAAGAAVAAEISALGAGPVSAVRADVSVEADVTAAVQAAVDAYGRLDILHNNAATFAPDVFGRDHGVVDMDVEVWDRTLAVNLRGAMLGCKHAIPRMREVGGGAIVTTSSVSALVGEDTHLAYACSKAGLGALTRHVATMHGREGIRVNAVASGLMLTPASLAALSPRQFEAFRCERILERAASPDDVANLVLFLASDQAACITGQVYVIDGGTLAQRPRGAMAAWEQFLATSEDDPAR